MGDLVTATHYMCSNCYRVIPLGEWCSCRDVEMNKRGSPEYLALLDRICDEIIPRKIREMKDLHRRKNAGYAGHSNDPWANFRKCEVFGISAEYGVLTRMSDKWSRLESLAADAKNDQVGESFDDTLLDLAAYALILVCLRQERFH